MQNPYSDMDFNTAVVLSAITHEHVFSQDRFMACWNRGNRIIPILHYSPSVPRYPSAGWNSVYEDWTDLTATEIAQRAEAGAMENFIDSDGNLVDVSELPCIPNSEKVNIEGYSGLHLCALGSSFGDPGWGLLPGGVTPLEGVVAWRMEHPLYTLPEMLDNIEANKYYDNTFVTINHPQASVSTLLQVLSKGTIKAVEGWNNGYSIEENQSFRDKIDALYKMGHRFWITAVVDWAGDWPTGRTEDLGCNILLLKPTYISMSKTDKEKEILAAYTEGRFYASGKRTISLSTFMANNRVVSIQLNKICETVKVITNKSTLTLSNVSQVNSFVDGDTSFVRFEAFSGTDFLFTNPVFYYANKRNSLPVLSTV
jgi:hypothetical protein